MLLEQHSSVARTCSASGLTLSPSPLRCFCLQVMKVLEKVTQVFQPGMNGMKTN